MSYCYRKSLLYLKSFTRTSPIPRLDVLLQHSPSTLEPKYSTDTSTSKKQSFRVNYLINHCGFSPETASDISKQVSFLNSERPDSVIELFRDLHISDFQLRDTIRKAPWLLSSDPVKTISSKFEFFKSKGASSSLLVHILTNNPSFLQKSLENHIIPSYDLMKGFLDSDESTIKTIQRCTRLLTDYRLADKIKLLLDNGVPQSGIARLLRHWPGIIKPNIDYLKTKLDEVMELGFDPSKTTFTEALRAKIIVSQSSWEKKVELYGRWGWSDEALRKAFTKRPFCMLKSDSKIEALMEFWVNRMGWDPLVLAEYPLLLTLCLEKRIIPRAFVLKFLQSSGLVKNAGCQPFIITEEKFYQKFVNCFKDEAPQLLKLYEEKLNFSQ